jgi:hypothetical protein
MKYTVYSSYPAQELKASRNYDVPVVTALFLLLFIILAFLLTYQSLRIDQLERSLKVIEAEQSEINFLFGVEPFGDREFYHDRRRAKGQYETD